MNFDDVHATLLLMNDCWTGDGSMFVHRDMGRFVCFGDYGNDQTPSCKNLITGL